MKSLACVISLSLCFVLSLFCSCQEDIDVDDCTPEIVVEGRIAEDGFPIVFVTTTVPLSVSQGSVPLDSLERHILNWARVEISDGHRSVVLTGRINNRYDVPCYFTTGDMRGEAGKTYRIDVTYDRYHATAVTTIPSSRPVVDSLTIVPVKNSDSLFAIMAHVPPQHSTGYYQFQVGVEGHDDDYYPSFMGVYTDQNIALGAHIPVYRPRNRLRYFDEDYVSTYHHGDKVHVRFAAMQDYAYNFWMAYEKFLSMGNNYLFPMTENLPSNIQGGLGLWYGFSYSAFSVEIP